MQAAKDSFYVALRDRLAQRNPQRTITIDGVVRPAIVVAEDEAPSQAPRQNDAYYLEWGKAEPATAGSVLRAMHCTFSYTSAGNADKGGLDRGRDITALDEDLLAICRPAKAEKYDYSTGTASDLRSTIFWTSPTLKPIKTSGAQIGHEATVTVFFFPEAGA